MTTFENGPAKGNGLALKSAPLFLRVTEAGGKFDALDLPTDTPRPEGKLHAYVRIGEPGSCHMNFGGGRGGFYTLARYFYVPNQPSDEVMRDASKWQQWCASQSSEEVTREAAIERHKLTPPEGVEPCQIQKERRKK